MFILIIRGLKLFKKENDENKLKVRSEEETECLKSTYQNGKESYSCNILKDFSTISEDSDIDQTKLENKLCREEIENLKLKELQNKEFEIDKINFPQNKIILIGISYVTLVLISLLKGSDHFESLIGIQSYFKKFI